MAAEELVEVAVLEILDRNEERLLDGAEPEYAGDVGVLENGEEPHFSDKFSPEKKERE